ncbi:ankyrin repeat domain-containing protein [Billgrantia diversa]|uniref:ankyrin repeat domain-containing protein n=1 Tax=Halomonas sp. MCCC 1A13316 TaxID=2733487 RepID=UPI0018A61B24|nr:ankyrin repeat domain-containing protein [Halomonas sp. MCCC 1A13316]QOR40208.1 ankyrin repeat domain-containing protein [Halomonas sp. MCCC 1A13316]
MSELNVILEEIYDQAKIGRWQKVLSEWKDFPVIAKRCSRYEKETSGWSFLHQAAYFGNVQACRELIRLGASANKPSRDGKTAVDVAVEKGFVELAALLQSSLHDEGSLWANSTDSDLGPSSDRWEEAIEHCAREAMLVAYAGGVVKIPPGARYFSDSFDRVLIGWHGTYDPPCGMDGCSML